MRVLVPMAPLLGLIGTVSGMLEVFDSMALRGSADARTMASGVSHAMICTMSGLAVSITGLYPVYHFHGPRETQIRTRRRTAELLTMRTRRHTAHEASEQHGIDLAPMLDFVLNLLIFFIIIAVFVKESGLIVQRPTGEPPPPNADKSIAIQILQNGEVWVDGRVDRRRGGARQRRTAARREHEGRRVDHRRRQSADRAAGPGDRSDAIWPASTTSRFATAE